MLFIFDIDCTPRIGTTANCFPVKFDFLVASDYSERNLGEDFFIFESGFGIVIFMTGIRIIYDGL